MPSSGVRPDPGITPASLSPPALAGGFFTASATWEALEQGGSVQLAAKTDSRWKTVEEDEADEERMFARWVQRCGTIRWDGLEGHTPGSGWRLTTG